MPTGLLLLFQRVQDFASSWAGDLKCRCKRELPEPSWARIVSSDVVASLTLAELGDQRGSAVTATSCSGWAGEVMESLPLRLPADGG